MNIFVSNLAGIATGQQVKTLFSEFGVVQSAVLIKKETAQEPGNYCWVVMQDAADAAHAIAGLDNSMFLHQHINVEQAIFALHRV